MEGAPTISMAVDLMAAKVAKAATETVDVAATAAVAMDVKAAERLSVDAVGVAATPHRGSVG